MFLEKKEKKNIKKIFFLQKILFVSILLLGTSLVCLFSLIPSHSLMKNKKSLVQDYVNNLEKQGYFKQDKVFLNNFRKQTEKINILKEKQNINWQDFEENLDEKKDNINFEF
jgi:hypothetical protein